MSYIFCNDNTVIIFEKSSEIQLSANLGELLFSFLELDLDEYNDLFEKFFYEDYMDVKDAKYLLEKYPKTAHEHVFMSKALSRESFSGYIKVDFLSPILLNNKDTFGEIYNHPYISLCDYFYEPVPFSFMEIRDKVDLKKIQNSMKKLIKFCFLDKSSEGFNALSAEQKYYIFCAAHSNIIAYTSEKHSEIYFKPMDLFQEIQKNFIQTAKNQENIDILAICPDILKDIKENVSLIRVDSCRDVKSFIFWEFYTLLEKDVKIRHCANCGKLFILKGEYETECCDNIPPGEKFTCKKIMAKKKRKEKVASNPIIREYNKAYKRYYARVTNKKISQEQFKDWIEESTKKRDEYSSKYLSSPNDSIIKEFKEYLGNR